MSAAPAANSSMADPRVVMVGAPHASASNAGSPNPSSIDGYTTAAAWRRSGGTSSSDTKPSRLIRSGCAVAAIASLKRFSSVAQLPPAMTSESVG